jgi:uncharacterized protein
MTSWRKACEEALRAHTQADAIRFWGVSHPKPHGDDPIFDYRFEHTLATVKLARWLAPLAGADPEIVECAAWLHDVRKYLNDPRSKDTHAQDASAAVEGILAGSDFPPAKISAVRHAIEHHVGLKLAHKLKPVETACLWDADKLSKIGAASLIHFSCIAGAFEPIRTEDILQRGEQWLPRAETIAASMNTEPAKAEAKRRVAFLVAHYQQLRREWADPVEPTPPSPGHPPLT